MVGTCREALLELESLAFAAMGIFWLILIIGIIQNAVSGAG